MGQTTIEWTATHHADGTVTPGYTFNPWWGCTKVSPGCQNCYAMTFDKRVGGDHWGPSSQRRFFGEAHWSEPLRWNLAAARAGVRKRVFCASMADVFEERPDLVAPRIRLCGMIRKTPHLDWLILTKRPQNIIPHLRNARDILEEELHEAQGYPPSPGDCPGDSIYHWLARWINGEVPANVWLGTSVENQETASERIPHLLQCPAAIRFLSCEPLLGPISLDTTLGCVRTWLEYNQRVMDGRFNYATYNRINWVIAGGESGQGARPAHPDWFRTLRDQCVAADVPYLFKQWGEWHPTASQEEAGRWKPIDSVAAKDRIHLWPDGEVSFKIGKKAAGRLLDGRAWDEFPQAAGAGR